MTHKELRLTICLSTGYDRRDRVGEFWIGIMKPWCWFRFKKDERFYSFILGPFFGAFSGPQKKLFKDVTK